MLLRAITENILTERQVWAKSGKKAVRKYRCTSGTRKGRVVSKIAQCYAVPDIKKRTAFKRTKLKLGKMIARKIRRTKKFNPVSKRVRSLNKSRR